MQSVIGALRVNLGLDSAQFERGSKRVDKNLQRMRRQFAAAAGAASAAFAGISAAALRGAQEIDRAAKSARRLDASVGAFRGLELAASEAGVSLSGLTNDIQSMNREIANIGRSGNADRALRTLKLEASDLAGLDADEKLARIADRVQEMGFDMGQTTAILRDFGIRNRETALLIAQGGDAIRQASRDVDEYGLSLSKVDSARIEKANDRIGRLGLVWNYVGDQLALKIVPTFGRLAETMTESLRAGGALRRAIDVLVDNLGRAASYVSTFVALMGARYVKAMVAARLATLSLSGALTTLAGTIARTSIFGAMVVGAGELVHQFGRLVAITGSFGEAMSVLGDVAVEVWGRLGLGAQAMVQSLKGQWAALRYDFNSAIAGMAEKAAGFFSAIAEQAGSVPFFGDVLEDQLRAATASMQQFASTTQITANGFHAAAEDANAASAELMAAATAPLESLQGLSEIVEETESTVTDAADAATNLGGTLGGDDDSSVAGGSKKAARETRKLADQIRRLEFKADPAKKYRHELAELNKLSKAGLSDGAYASAVQDLNDELAESMPMIGGVSDAFGDLVTRGFKDFSGFADKIKGDFQNMISSMVATAARNRIMIGLGFGGAGSVAGAGAAVAQGGNLLGQVSNGGFLGLGGAGGSLLGSFGSGGSILGMGGLAAGSGFLGGLGSSLSGGLGGMMNIGGSAAMAGGGIGATIGAAVPAIAAVAAAVSFFSSKTKELDRGLRVTVKGMDGLVETFRKTETSRFWGLSKSRRTDYDRASAEVADPILRALGNVQGAVADSARALGVHADAFANYSARIKISTDGLSDGEVTEKIQERFAEVSDEMAGMAINAERYARVGEGAAETLRRLATDLGAVNDAFDRLGLSAYGASAEMAAGASRIVEAAGGMDAFTGAVSTYMQEFYTQEERVAAQTRRLSDQFADLGVRLPRSRAQFRDLLEGIDRTSVGGQRLYGELISMSGALAQVLPQVQSMSSALAGLVGSISTQIDGLISDTSELQRAQENAAQQWYRAADSLRAFIADMRTTSSALISRVSAARFARVDYERQLGAARDGDAEAAQGLGGAASTLLQAAQRTAGTRAELAAVEARIMRDLAGVSGLATVEGQRHDVISGLLGEQATILTDMRDYLQSGQALSQQQIGAFQQAYKEVGASIEHVRKMTPNAFQASDQFKSWFEATERDQVAKPMSTLGDRMDRLRGGMSGLLSGLTDLRLSLLRDGTETFSGDALTRALRASVGGTIGDRTQLLAAANLAGVDVAGRSGADVARDIERSGGRVGIRDYVARQRFSADDLGGSVDSASTLASRGSRAGSSFEGRVTAQYRAARERADQVIASIRDLESSTGASLRAGRSAATLRIGPGGGWINYDASHIDGPRDAMPEWRRRFWSQGGLEDQIFGARQALSAAKQRLDASSIPAFASGGLHGGGLRVVGERGPEIEATGPSRIWSANQTRDMLGGSDLAAEMRALREEVGGLRRENRDLQRQIAQNTDDSVRLARRRERMEGGQ